jgi:gliding motility-associated-like protein
LKIALKKYCYCIFFVLGILGIENGYAQVANFTISVPSKQGCSPLSVNFVDISTGGTVASRIWDLGNGTIINPGGSLVGANYTIPQKYYIKLTVTFTNGVVKEKLDSIVVHPKPVADFGSLDIIGCAPHTANFASTSTTATGTITNWQWDFGPGGINGTNGAPFFIYNNAGLYQVSLIVKNNWGCESDAKTKPQFIKVFNRPNASFTATPNYTCANSFTANFTNTTTGGDPLNNQYEWDFGDGSPHEFTKDPLPHLYTGAGNYTAILTVKLGNNCVSTYPFIIRVGTPSPAFGTFPDVVCVNNPIQFTGTSTPTNNTAYIKWIFTDNGQQQFYSPVTHTFTILGTHEVQLISYNFNGLCRDTIRRSILVKPGPIINVVPDFPSSACAPHTVTFTNNTVGTDLKFAWDWGDFTPVDTINGQLPATHTYLNFGTYRVTIYAKDTSTVDGCSAYKFYDYIRIYKPSVTINVVPPSGCRPLPVNFSATVSNPSGVPITSYIWDFGEGAPQTTTAPSSFHLYNSAGTFPVTVTIVMQGGCSYTSLVKTVTVINLCDDDGSGGGGGGGGGFVIGKNCDDKYTIIFTDTVANSTVISWDFGDGSPLVTTGLLNPIVHTFPTTQKVYIVKITRSDNATGVVTSSEKRIIIIDEKANFLPDRFDICKGIRVNFKTSGIDSSLIRKYTWDYGDGTPRFVINNAQNFSIYGTYLNGNTNHTYNTNGVFFVKLIIEDKLGCKDSLEYPVPITVAGPIARFSAGPLTSCTSPLITTFTDASVQNGTNPITEWQWTFGDATPVTTYSNNVPFTHTYTGNNAYNAFTVKLKIKDGLGCEADTTIPNYIKIYKPKADFFSYNTLQCGNYSAAFYGYPSQGRNITYQWFYGDGQSSPITTSWFSTHTYAYDDSFDVQLKIQDENGCRDSLTIPNYIKIVKPKADFKISDTLKCAPASITFADSSKFATSYIWDFGDNSGPATGPNPAPHIYGTPGYYNVKLKITGPSGCIDSIVKRIRVRGPIGNLSITGNQGCKPFNLPLKVTGSFINTYAWDFGDGTPVNPNTVDSVIIHPYTTAGKYLPNVVLTSPEGCPYTLKATDTIYVDSLRARFTLNQNVFCQTGTTNTVTFNNLTTVPAFSNVIYNFWSFGDNNTEVNSNATVSHSYSGYGTFNVYLATKSKYGCVDTMKVFPAVSINAKPIPSITGDDVYCLRPNSQLQYTGSVISPDPIAKHKWMIDADSVSNTPNLSVNYRVPGVHTLKYIVRTSNNCIDSITKVITIDSVTTKFILTPAQNCGPKLVSFTNQSTNASALQNFQWTFGDNTTETLVASPQHFYGKTGEYDVKLFLQTVNGCKDSLEKIAAVTIDSIPKAVITGDALKCKTGNYTYTSANVVTLDNINIYEWKVDGNTVGSSPNLNHNFTAGNHTITLKIKTTKGCEDEVTKNIIVDSLVTNFTVDKPQICGNNGQVKFTNSAFAQFGITGYRWDFGDNTFSTNPNPTHDYTTDGAFTVKLVITSANGCLDSIVLPKAVTIYKNPDINITGNDLHCSPGTYTYNSAIITANPISTYKWELNNTTISNAPNISYPLYAGTQNLTFIAITDKGCKDTSYKQIKVDSLISKFAIPNPNKCGVPATIQFNENAFAQFGILKYTWNFGNGNNSNNSLPNPTSTYNASGSFPINLNIESNTGCSKVSNQVSNVVIYDKPVVTINGSATACANSTLDFTGLTNAQDEVISKEWKINNVAVGTSNTLSYLFTNAGLYTITFNVKTKYGCDETQTHNLIVNPLPVPNAAPNTTVCLGSSVQLSASSGTNYSWTPANATLLNPNSATPVAKPTVTTKYYVLVKNQFGCEKRDSVLIQVDIPVNLVQSPDMTICEGGSAQLSASGNASSYKWTGAGLNNPNIPNPIAKPTVTTTYQVVAYSSNLCKNDTADVTVTIDPTPTVNAGADTTVNAGAPVQLNAIASPTVINYKWVPSFNLDCINCPSPKFNADKTTQFVVTAYTQFGCLSTDTVTVVVLCNKGAVYIPTVFTPNGDGKNDRFAISGYGISKVKRFAVFNRYGEIVFERKDFNPTSNSIANSWDGKVKGKEIGETTTFVYLAEVQCAEGSNFMLKNTVVVIK